MSSSHRNEAAPRAARSAVESTLQILTAAACGMAALLALLPAAGHDQMWLLYAARLHAAGATLYGPELFETNPPMGIWLSAVPEALARLLRLPETAMGKLLVVLVGAGVAAWSLRLLRRLFAGLSPELSPRLSPRVSKTAVWWLAFVWVCLTGVVPARDFGQRDHLLAMLVVPYILAAAVRASGETLPLAEAGLIGLAAGLGICLKPHQALIPVAVELALLAFPAPGGAARVRRGVRPETGAIVLTGLCFLAAVRLWAPLYFASVLPIARDTYWAFHPQHFSEVLAQAAQLHVLILADLALLAVAIVADHRLNPLVPLLFAAGTGATVAYYLQGTGWYYQQLPALTLFGLAFGFLVLEVIGTRPAQNLPRWIPIPATALGALALFLTAHFMGYPFTADRSFPIDAPDPSFFAGLPPGSAVATLTTTVDYTVPPLFRYGLVLAQRYPHLWMLPAILRNDDPEGRSPAHPLSPARVAQLDRLQHQFMAEDLRRWQPRLLLVERCQDSSVHCQVLEDRHDNLLAFFLRDPAFRAEFAHYRYWRSAGAFDGWLRVD